MIPHPTQEEIHGAMRSFLLAVMPTGTGVYTAQANRVPEPKEQSFVMMSLTRMTRLGTNFDAFADVRYIGSIINNDMAVQSVDFGTIKVGANVYGIGVIDGTVITEQVDGTPGGTGNYKVFPPQDIALEVLASGAEILKQPTEVTFQLDFHSADMTTSGDMAQVVSTLFRDGFGVAQFANQSPNYGVVPLHADEASQMPFLNDQQQYEWRWVVQAKAQVDIDVSVPQQYADAVNVGLIEVDGRYPP